MLLRITSMLFQSVVVPLSLVVLVVMAIVIITMLVMLLTPVNADGAVGETFHALQTIGWYL